MIRYPEISPELISIGPLKIRWYGLMYVLGFFVGFQVLKWRIRQGLFRTSYKDAENYVTYLIVGMLLGARLVYVFVYDWETYSSNLLQIFYIWQGGLSFHGAMLGMVTAGWLYGRSRKMPFYMVSDSFAMTACPGLMFGRIGNFINGELYGRATDVPWAMIFPTDPDRVPRHPSQIYQGLTEGLLLFLVLLWVQRLLLRKGIYKLGYMSATFLMGYGVLRFLTEFTRQPDVQLGFVLGPFSMGQILCFLTLLWGVFVLWQTREDPVFVPKAPPPEFLQ